jgi:hypothetical protein
MKPGVWNLLDQHQRPGSCCDNAPMGEQMEFLRDVVAITAHPEAPVADQALRNIAMSARRGRAYGSSGVPALARQIEYHHERFDEILRVCAEMGHKGSILRSEAPVAETPAPQTPELYRKACVEVAEAARKAPRTTHFVTLRTGNIEMTYVPHESETPASDECVGPAEFHIHRPGCPARGASQRTIYPDRCDDVRCGAEKRRRERETPAPDPRAASGEARTDDEPALRRLLWLRHGCPFAALYGDDGEMQCSSCMVDFKRSPVEFIERQFMSIGERLLHDALHQPRETTGTPTEPTP